MPTTSILAHFQELDDPRVSPATRHQLLDIVAIALCAVICGADTWVEVEAFGRAKEPWLRTFLALPHGIPSHDTFGRVFAALDPHQFEAGFRSWVAAVAAVSTGTVVAVDGKTLRRSHDRTQGKAALVLVSAWAAANRLTLGQVAVAPGANEIPAIPALLQQLALEGSIVTVDAIGCQTAIATQVIAQEADYVLTLKENQETLLPRGRPRAGRAATTTISAGSRKTTVASRCARSGRWRIRPSSPILTPKAPGPNCAASPKSSLNAASGWNPHRKPATT